MPQFALSEPVPPVHQFDFLVPETIQTFSLPSTPEEPSHPFDNVNVQYRAADITPLIESELEPEPDPVPKMDLFYILDQLLLEDINKEIEVAILPLSVPF